MSQGHHAQQQPRLLGSRSNPIVIDSNSSSQETNNRNNATSTNPGPFHWVTDSDKREALKDLIARCPFGVDGTTPHRNMNAVSFEAYDEDDVTAQDIRTKVRPISSGHCFFMDTLEDLYNRHDWKCPVTRKPFTQADLRMIRAYVQDKAAAQAHTQTVSWPGYIASEAMSNKVYRIMGLLGAQDPAFRIPNLHLQTVRGEGIPANWPQEPNWARGSPAGAVMEKTATSSRLKLQIRAKGRRGAQAVTVVELAAGMRGNLVASFVKKMASRVRTVRELYTLVGALKHGQVTPLNVDSMESFWYIRQLYRFIYESATVVEPRP